VFGGLVDLNRGSLDALAIITSDSLPDIAAEFQVKAADPRLAVSSPTSPRVFSVGGYALQHPELGL
jgi:hypothetical protein